MSLKLYFSLIFISVLLTTGLLPYIYKRVAVKGAKELLFLTSTIDFWLLCQLCYFIAASDQLKLFFHELKFVGIVLAPVAMFKIAIELCAFKKLARPKVFNVFFIMPAITLMLIATNPMHHWFRKTIQYENHEGFRLIFPQNGWWYHVNMYYLLTVVGVTMLFFGVYFLKSKEGERIQYLVFLIAGGFPWLMSIIYHFVFKGKFLADLTPLGLTVTTLVLIWGLFFHKLMHIIPVAGYEVYQSIQDGIVVTNLKDQILHMNPAARHVFGLTQDEDVFGVPREVLFSKRGIGSSDVEASEGELRLPSGEGERVFTYQKNWIDYFQGLRVGQIYVFSDITPLDRLKEELKKIHQKEYEEDQKKRIYISNMNKEIRKVLNPLVGRVDYLKQLKLTPEDYEQIEMLSFSADILLKLMNDITDYTRIETGDLKLHKTDFNVHEVFWHLVQMYQYEAEKKALSLTLRMEPGVPEMIQGDPLRFTQILNNLISNAVKFTQKGEIQIHVKEINQCLIIEVSDTGIGIKKDAQATIFNAYRQEDDQITLRFGGTGLGLAIVKQLVDLMEGTIELKSVIGEGSTFTLRIPFELGNRKVSQTGYKEFMTFISRTYRILIISDVPDHYEVIELYFKTCLKAEIEVRTVHELDFEAIEWEVFDLLIVDLESFNQPNDAIESFLADMKSCIQCVGLTTDINLQQKEHPIYNDYLLMPVGFDKMNRVFSKVLFK